MTTVIVGANGQLGRALQQEFPDAVALDRSQLDVTDADGRRATTGWADVDVVLNAAAWTAVDAAEDPANLDAVRAANVDAVGHLARAVRTSGATLVHISSEYVFDGTHDGPHPRGLAAEPAVGLRAEQGRRRRPGRPRDQALPGPHHLGRRGRRQLRAHHGRTGRPRRLTDRGRRPDRPAHLHRRPRRRHRATCCAPGRRTAPTT